MIRKIVDEILPFISGLNFADVVAGCVITISKEGLAKDKKTIIEKFPAYYNADKNACNNYSDYIDLIPNSAKKSIIYFEENGNQFIGQEAYYYKVASNVKLICWANLEKINKSYTDAHLLKSAIMKTIPDSIPNIAKYYSFIRIAFQSEEIKSYGIFSKYTFKEEKKQFLLYPFDYFCLNYRIEYWIAKNCLEEIIIDPGTCLT